VQWWSGAFVIGEVVTGATSDGAFVTGAVVTTEFVTDGDMVIDATVSVSVETGALLAIVFLSSLQVQLKLLHP
jgi:ABC-type uncharacterized transport system permease subunit